MSAQACPWCGGAVTFDLDDLTDPTLSWVHESTGLAECPTEEEPDDQLTA